ncbi:relaxase [Salmonella enterica]|nr:relaxase [Salmonella enterica]ELT0036076.1 relaxase [Salmonella enterica]
MITRYGGGNTGIAEYLEYGRKAEREYTRDELDHRLILDGDLQTTNKVIQSIEDKGQERYLHITLSFQESEISAETLKSVTQEYKELFMNAYHEDEYCFYAEAHLPKIKNLVDNRTGELVERKPHIHIVIPRTNLVTERSMNPVSDLTNTKTQEQLDAIQEYINNKYNLVSPKDAVRVSEQNYANVLSRTKGDLFNEHNNDVKRAIYTRLESENIRSFSDFKTLLSEYGEVKIRNAGKAGEYFSVKLDGDKKFTNLKNPLFSKKYVESRELPLIKPTEKQISARLEAWTSRASHEIKHIYPASSRIRESYKALDEKGKAYFLAERIKSYDERNKLNKRNIEQTRGRQSRNERGFNPASRLDRIKAGIGLPCMPQRGLVHGINGRAAAPEFVSVLSNHEQRDMAEQLQERQRINQTMRRDTDRRFIERGIKTIEQSSVLYEHLFDKLNKEAEINEISTMSKVRKELDPERFLSGVALSFNVKPDSYKISKANDGSPRFAVGNRNLNASDFLTKHLNLSWADAKQFLVKTYSEQLSNKPYDKVKTTNRLTPKLSTERFNSLKSSNKTLRDFVRNEKQKMYTDLRMMRKDLRDIPKNEREVAKGVLVYKKLTTLETLAEMENEGRNLISQYHLNWNKDKDPMKALDKLKNYINREEENGIMANEPEVSLEKAVESQRKIEEVRRNNARLKDLVMDKREGKIIYRDQETESPVFTDKGDFVVSGKNPTKEEIGVMLDYSKEKFGGVLKLTGSNEFKEQCALVAAEKGMNVILRPEKYQTLMLETKAELESGRVEKETQPQNDLSNESANDKDLTIEKGILEKDKSHDVPMEKDNVDKVYDIGVINRATELNSFMIKDGASGDFGYLKGFDRNENVTYEVLGHAPDDNEDVFTVAHFDNENDAKEFCNIINDLGVDKTLSLINSQSEKQYIVTFTKDELNANIRGFNSVEDALEYKNKVSMLHEINKKDAIIYSVSNSIVVTKGIQNVLDDAVPVPRHELERAQGRDVNEQDGKILEAIDQYQDKFVAEGLDFDRASVEAELLHHDLTRDVAEDRLEQKYTEEKAAHSEKERDAGLER